LSRINLCGSTTTGPFCRQNNDAKEIEISKEITESKVE